MIKDISGNRIEKRIELRAPLSRVWQAISDPIEFGTWFGVKLEGPFVVGQEARGKVTYPGYEHVVWRAVIKEIVHEQRFAFTWHPYAIDQKVDYTTEAPTLVTFTLTATQTEGTLLIVTESGFDKIPAHRRAEAFMRNDGGWTQQMKNIEAHVAKQG